MRRVFPGVILCLLCACTGHVGTRRPPVHSAGPPELQVRFDSASASAYLSWGRVWQQGFSHYEVQHFKDGAWVGAGTVAEAEDTTLVVPGLRSGVLHRYRVLSHLESGEDLQALASPPVEGGIHLFVRSWTVGGEGGNFLPTCLAVSDGGVVFAAGVGSGRVERFDRSGRPLGSWEYASDSLACLQTSTLDGPDLALDGSGNLHLVYNLLQADGEAPRAFWTKFDPRGQRLWQRPLPGLYARHIAIEGERIFIEGIGQVRQFDPEGGLVKQSMTPPQLVSRLRFWKGRFAALIEPLSLAKEGWRAPKLVVYQDLERRKIASSIRAGPPVLRGPRRRRAAASQRFRRRPRVPPGFRGQCRVGPHRSLSRGRVSDRVGRRWGRGRAVPLCGKNLGDPGSQNEHDDRGRGGGRRHRAR